MSASLSDSPCLFQVRRTLSVRRDAKIERVLVGLMRPAAVSIESPPPYLDKLIECWSEPRTLDDVVADVSDSFPDFEPAGIRLVAEDLIISRIAAPPWPFGRYDRHQLYFELLGFDPSKYERLLASKRVGVVGVGGIGSTAAALLAAAGVGELTLSDGDRIEASNLTRTTLFDESVLGQQKVFVAKSRLEGINSNISVRPVNERYGGPDFVERHFGDCDILLVSADEPTMLHRWTNAACQRLSIPYIVAGYIETWASVGPLFVPGATACFECSCLHGANQDFGRVQLNKALQAPSYGPLNSLSASIAVNEVLRHLLDLEPVTLGRRLLINSTTYEIEEVEFPPHPECQCKAGEAAAAAGSRSLASVYGEYRESSSLNQLILDDLVVDQVCDVPGTAILDVGCGIGTLAAQFARRGHEVTAVDSCADMLAIFKERLPKEHAGQVHIVMGDAETAEWGGPFDRILINLLLDHLADPRPLLKRCVASLRQAGRLVIVVPHPFKDAGSWQKRRIKGNWRYDRFLVDNYFSEGPIQKQREDASGDVILTGMITNRRTLATYFKMLTEAGLRVESILEPEPSQSSSSSDFNKSSRIPYFLIFRCGQQNNVDNTFIS